MELRIRIPVGELLPNLLGLLGLLGVAVCLGGLTSWWVAGLVGSLELVGLAYVAHAHAAQTAAAGGEPARPVRAA